MPMLPEEKARVKIDKQLRNAGWDIVTRNEYLPNSIDGTAIRIQFKISGLSKIKDILTEINEEGKHDRNLLGGLYRENPVKSRNYEAVKSSKKWENVGNSYIIPALLLYRYSYI